MTHARIPKIVMSIGQRLQIIDAFARDLINNIDDGGTKAQAIAIREEVKDCFNQIKEYKEDLMQNERHFTCQCNLDYFKAKIITGSIKRYLSLECPACGQTIEEDLSHG
ncbi:MAG: hypothetical protein HZR80_21075 [Candidatus Heimdallarchaeota archaeon]